METSEIQRMAELALDACGLRSPGGAQWEVRTDPDDPGVVEIGGTHSPFYIQPVDVQVPTLSGTVDVPGFEVTTVVRRAATRDEPEDADVIVVGRHRSAADAILAAMVGIVRERAGSALAAYGEDRHDAEMDAAGPCGHGEVEG